MTFAATEPSGFASKWLPFQPAKRHVTNVKKLAKMLVKVVYLGCIRVVDSILTVCCQLKPDKFIFVCRQCSNKKLLD